jgi:hypothetical protein
LGQLVASQMHWPPLQRWPALHADRVPHMQAPLVQTLALVVSHAAQVLPEVPQIPTAWLE